MHERFENISELSVLLEKTDKAEINPVWQGHKDPTPYDEFQTVYNISKERPVNIVKTSRGQVINHSDALQPLVHALEQQEGAEVFGFVHDHGDQVMVEALFNNIVVDDGADGIRMGIRVINDYSRLSVKGETFGYRTVCDNGQALGRTIGSVLSCSHTSISRLETQMMSLIENSLNKAKMLTDTIEKAKVDKFVSEQDALKVLIGNVAGEALSTKMLELIEITGDFSRWNVYNAITNYATHTAVTESQKYNLQRQAQKILVTDSGLLNRGELKADRDE